MADLAGFDVIVEVHKDTIVDAINLYPLPKDGGDDFRLLGGPFSVELSFVVPQVGPATLDLIVEITLEAVVHQSVARLLVALRSGSCTLAGRAIDHVGGSLVLDVPLVFQLGPDQSVDGSWQIMFQTPSASATCQFDAVTQAKIGAVLQATDVANFINALIQAIRQLVGPVIPLPIPQLKVVPGVHSTDPLQLSAVPIVAWIDAFTLGVFGYYSSGSGGSVSAKKQGDLYQANDEFMYGLSSTELVTPTRRVALLVSAGAAHRVLLCPLIRESVIRPWKIEQERQRIAEDIFSYHFQERFTKKKAERRLQYFAEELAKPDPGPSPFEVFSGQTRIDRAWNRAETRVEDEAGAIAVEVDADITEQSRKDLNDWLNSAASGPAIAQAVPPPCGTGEVQALRQRIDAFSVQSDHITVKVRQFDIAPDDGRLMVHYEAYAFIEDFFGDVEPNVRGDIEITLDVDYFGAVGVRVTVLQPTFALNATGLVGTLSDILQGGAPGTWQSMLTFVELLLQQQLQTFIHDALFKKFDLEPAISTITKNDLAVSTTMKEGRLNVAPLAKRAIDIGIPFSGRARDIQITKESILLIGLIARHPNYNVFSPALLLTIDKSLTASTQAPIDGRLDLPKTDWGCPGATFSTTRKFWDTEIRVKARPRDLNMPLTIGSWTIEIGNFTLMSIGQFSVPDPRPRWSGTPVPIKSGTLHLSGVVNHPDPPLTDIDGGPFPLGHLTSNPDIEVTVTGSDDTGWSIRFRGTDGNFFVRVVLEATDGDNVPCHGETFVTVKGDELQLPSEYVDYKAACDAKYKAYRQLKQALAPPVRERVPVLPGQDVSLLQQAARDVGQMIQAGDPAAITRLEAIRQRHGPDALRALPLLLRGSTATRGG